MKRTLLLWALGSLVASAAIAQPGGDWVLWKQTATGKTTCNQSPIGPGWVKGAGPFEDPDCKVQQK